MAGKSLSKLSISSARRDFDRLLLEMVRLGCVEVSEPKDLSGFPELEKAVTHEYYDISKLNANREDLMLLGTRHTLMLTGWIPAKSAPALRARLHEFVCAWDIREPSPDEAKLAPVKLALPGFFGRQRLAGRRLFKPLCGGGGGGGGGGGAGK